MLFLCRSIRHILIKTSILIVIFKGSHSAVIFLFKLYCLLLRAPLSLSCVKIQVFSICAVILLVAKVILTYESCQNHVSFSIYILIPTLDFFQCFILLHCTYLSPENCQCGNKSLLILFPATHTPSLYKFNFSHIHLYTAYEECFF